MCNPMHKITLNLYRTEDRKTKKRKNIRKIYLIVKTHVFKIALFRITSLRIENIEIIKLSLLNEGTI